MEEAKLKNPITTQFSRNGIKTIYQKYSYQATNINFLSGKHEIVWLITLLANQSILIYNLKHKDAPKDLLTEEEVELLTSTLELASYKNAITEAMFKGTARDVVSESEDDGSKNTQGA